MEQAGKGGGGGGGGPGLPFWHVAHEYTLQPTKVAPLQMRPGTPEGYVR